MSVDLEERVDVLEDVVGRFGTALIQVLDNLERATREPLVNGPVEESVKNAAQRKVARHQARKMINFLRTIQIEEEDVVDPRQLNFSFAPSSGPKPS